MTMLDDENTIGDDIREAMTPPAAPEPAAVEPAAVEEAAPVSSRDENGRFKPREAAEPVAEAAAETPEGEESEFRWTHTRPPSSWTSKAREDWALIPEHLQKEITRREEAAHLGARKLQETYAGPRALLEAVKPLVVEVSQAGVNPIEHIRSLMLTERVLRTADLPTKFKTLLTMADQFGIPLRQVVNQSVGEEVLKAPSQQESLHPEIKRELDEIRAWREEQEQAQLAAYVEDETAGMEFLEDVRMDMADLIERGIASSLQDAYDRATWANPQVREVLLSRQAAPPPAQSPVAARQSRAVGASVKPSNVIDVPVEEDSETDSIADTLRKTMARATTGRL